MKDKRNILIIALAVFLMGVALPAVSSAAVVFAECAYTDTDLECYIYADTGTDELRSGGVMLSYATSQLTVTGATKNENDWYFGDPQSDPPGTNDYMDPETLPAGEVVIIVGKLDSRTGPPDLTGVGVGGARALIGIVNFNRDPGSDTALFGLGLDLGRSTPYVNFVNTAGTDLDGMVSLNTPVVLERGDANADGYITNSDYIALKNDIDSGVYKVYSDCNKDGFITNSDYICLRNKLP